MKSGEGGFVELAKYLRVNPRPRAYVAPALTKACFTHAGDRFYGYFSLFPRYGD